jgi:hypothetical protein
MPAETVQRQYDLVADALRRNEIVTDIEDEALESRLLEIFRATLARGWRKAALIRCF